MVEKRSAPPTALDPLAEWREATESAAPTPAESARLRAAILAEPRPAVWRWLLPVPAVMAAAAVLLVALWPADKPWGSPLAATPCLVVDDTTARSTCDVPVAIQVGDDHLELSAGTTVAQIPEGLRMSSGRVVVEVTPRDAGRAPFRLRTSGGVITVLGTRFTVEDRGETGRIEVARGRVRFDPVAGEARELGAGEALDWGPEASVSKQDTTKEPGSAAPTPPRRRPPPAPPTPQPMPEAVDVEALMKTVVRLKSQRRHPDAEQALRSAVATGGLTPTQAERLSFELGESLTRRGAPSACEHWRRHQEQYPTGPRASAVRTRLANCSQP